MMNYQETINYMYRCLPMFQRQGAAAYKADLGNTLSICRLTGNPEKLFPSVHIAGTNGKGSVAHMLASVMQEAGFKTGLYTSPHLRDFRERIRINGQKIPENYVIDFVAHYRKGFEEIQPSFFEMTFAMSMRYFADQKVDIAIVETGMGGRLDSTNVVRSVCSVITNIGLDHTQFLGGTIEAIAGEKAGIIKNAVPVVLGPMRNEARKVIRQQAKDKKTELIQSDGIWQAEFSNDDLLLKSAPKKFMVSNFPLKGNYQLLNVLPVMSCLQSLSDSGWRISDDHIVNGLRNVVGNTHFAGRWQKINHPDHPDKRILCDTGHNADGLRQVIWQLRAESYEKLHFVLGMVNDKDVDSVLELLPKDALYYFARPDIPRGLDAQTLRARAENCQRAGAAYPSVKLALQAALKAAGKHDLVFVGGSTFVVAEVVDV